MEILNKKRQTLEEMKKEFKGFCVCAIDCRPDSRGFLADGIAIIKDEWMDNVEDEFDEYEKRNTVQGKIYFEDFTDTQAIINSSMMVISYESD